MTLTAAPLRIGPPRGPEHPLGLISVVIPVFNEEASLGRDLAAITAAMDQTGWAYASAAVALGFPAVRLVRHSANRGVGRRPRRFRVDHRGDLAALQAAARLTAERPAAEGAPTPDFVTRLGARLLAGESAAQAASGRRSFLAAALAGLAAGLGAGFGAGRAGVGAPAATPNVTAPPAPATEPAPTVPLIRNNGSWFPVGTLSDLGERGAIRFTAGALEGHLVKHQDQVTALSVVCSHLPCTLVWRPGPDDFLCPCHDVAFSKGGEATNTQRPLPPLTKLDVKVENGEVFVWSVYIRGAKPGEPKVADPYASG